MSESNGSEKNTSYGVFVQACWAQHTRQYPDHLIHKEIEEFNKQCSVWWYNLSEQERDRFQEVADRSNAQQGTASQGYSAQENHSAITSSADFQNGNNGKMHNAGRDLQGVSTTSGSPDTLRVQNGAGLHQNGASLDQGGDGIQSYLNSFNYGEYGLQGDGDNVSYAVNSMGSGGQQVSGMPSSQGHHRMQAANPVVQRPNQKAMKDPNAPKKPLSAYFLFSQDERVKVKAENPDYSITDVAKELGRRWAAINPALKLQYEQKYQAAKTIYDRDTGSTKPQKKKKDPNAPKQPLSAYFIFSAEERLKIKDENPNISICEVAKELGRRWAELDPSLKQKFQALAEEGRQKYDVDMAAYRKGTFQHPEAQASIDNRQVSYQQAQAGGPAENKQMGFQQAERVNSMDNRQQAFQQTASVISMEGRQQRASDLSLDGRQSHVSLDGRQQAASDLSLDGRQPLSSAIAMGGRQHAAMDFSRDNRQQAASIISLDSRQQTISAMSLDRQQPGSEISLDRQQTISAMSLDRLDRQQPGSEISLDRQQTISAMSLDRQQPGSAISLDRLQTGSAISLDSRQQEASAISLDNRQPAGSVISLDSREQSISLERQQPDSVASLDGHQSISISLESRAPAASVNSLAQHSPVNDVLDMSSYGQGGAFQQTDGAVDLAGYGAGQYQQVRADQHSPPNHPSPSPSPNYQDQQYLSSNGLSINGIPANDHPNNGINGIPANDHPTNGINGISANDHPTNGLPKNDHPSNGLPTDYSSLLQ